jgi:hypothetical protein
MFSGANDHQRDDARGGDRANQGDRPNRATISSWKFNWFIEIDHGDLVDNGADNHGERPLTPSDR